jgi:tetratricopeptide (TPR) repeat protein
MNAQQQQLVDRLFEQIVGLPKERQAGFLDEKCSDEEVRREIEWLIACATGSPLSGMISAIGEVASSVTGAGVIGQRVGQYRLAEWIGQGGMGTVYRADRDDDQFRQTVAIKILRFSPADPLASQRFRRERQILAGLEHPYIARLLDGGEWDALGYGVRQPYIVMELVEGQHLTTHCKENGLNVRQRLLLFRQVCDAVSYAHQRLVIHRDIKPANILVSQNGTPKLLDFGVAKLLDPQMINPAAESQVSATVAAMTPDYASPEQVRGEPVSTVTDVYSLGVVLYELLTGSRPHGSGSRDFLEIAHRICEQEVAAPSLVAGRQYRGDLDVIVTKALQKDPARRYASVEQFSGDVRRHLEGLPIVARPDTLAYRGAKFIRRHLSGVIAVSVLFLALVGGIAAALVEKRRADTEAATAKAVNAFLEKDLLEKAGSSAQASPATEPDPDLKVRTALDRAAARLPGKFATQPAVEISIRHTIGKTYMDLGLLSEARRQLEAALRLARERFGEEYPEKAGSLYDLGGVSMLQGRYSEAESLFSQALQLQRRALGEEHPDTLNTMRELGSAYESQGRYAQAESLYTQGLKRQRRLLGDDHPDVLNTTNNLAGLYRVQRKHSEAEALYESILKVQRRVLGKDHPDTLTVMNNLASVYGYEGKFEESETLHSEVVNARIRVQGSEHPLTLSEMCNLAITYRNEGKYVQAEALLRTTLQTQQRVLGEENPDTLDTKEALAVLCRILGRHAQAETLFVEVLKTRRRTQGEEGPDTLFTMGNLGLLYRLQGRYREAEELFIKELDARCRLAGSQHPTVTPLFVTLGELMLDEQRFSEAETRLREALLRYEKAMPDDWRRFKAESLLGASLVGQAKYVKAEPLLLEGYEGLLQRKARMTAENRNEPERVGKWIVKLYQDWDKPEKAAEWRRNIGSRAP